MKRLQCKDLPTDEILFAMWAYHEQVRQINGERAPEEIKTIDLELVKLYPPDVVKVMRVLPPVKFGSTWIDWEGDPVTAVFVSPTQIHYVYQTIRTTLRGATVRQFLESFEEEK